MAISTYAEFLSRLSSRAFLLPLIKSVNVARNYLGTGTTLGPFVMTTPTTSVACDNTTTGAINKETPVGQTGFSFVPTVCSIGGPINNPSHPLLVDRLVHSGGLSGTVTTAQTTNLPTATLTRYTSGVGVFAAVEIYTAIGATATTATISYTNSDGTAGRTSQPVVIGSSNFQDGGRFIIFPLQDGDKGVKSVESFTLAASTGTAGNMGIVLFKPLTMFYDSNLYYNGYNTNSFNSLLKGGMQFEPAAAGACLIPLHTAAVSSGSLVGNIRFTDIT